MEKFGLMVDYLQQKNLLTQANCYRPGRIKPDVLVATHDSDYVERFVHNRQSDKERREMGLPWSEGLCQRTLISPNGTLLAASLALKHGVACHLAGGTHHAHRNRASGFCIFNDLAITANALLALNKVNSVLIIDCDVHQGDGTAALLANEPRAITCSIHCEKNFPVRKVLSDHDIALPPKLGDEPYLAQVESTVNELLVRYQPDIVLYDAGVDVYEHDPLGLLSITEEGIRQRERLVLSACQQKGVPVATVIGGGYDDDRRRLAQRHSMVVEEAFALYADK